MSMSFPRLILATTLVLSLGACATSDYGRRGSSYAGDGYSSRDRGYADDGYASNRSRCNNCGTVERIGVDRGDDGRTSGAGAVAGAVLGAAIGNQVGSGDGRKAATVAGAVAGGIAGNNIERNRNQRDEYEVVVRMDSGRTVVLEQRELHGIREGSRVVVSNGRARGL